MADQCAFCVPDESVTDGMHPDVPFILVWAGKEWRLFLDLTAESDGFSLLAPRRHNPSIAQLTPAEALSLGQVLPRLTGVMQEATGAEAVYLYSFNHPHVHIHLAPHSTGDALSEVIIKGSEINQQQGGLQWATSPDYPPLPRETLMQTARRVQARLLDIAEL